MSDSEHPHTPIEEEATMSPEDEGNSTTAPTLPDEESTGDTYLDKLLEEGILKGMARMDLAQTLLAAFIVIAIGWFAFANTLSMSFLMDEQTTIADQESLHRIPTISAAWNDTIAPVTAFFHALNWTMADGSPLPFRITQLIIHLLNAVLVFLLCRMILKDNESEAIPLSGGLLFAVHPLTTYAVTPLTERNILLATCFMLLSLVLYTHAIRDTRINLVKYLLSIMAFGVAWSCGTWTGILPILIILLTLSHSGWKSIKSHAPYIGGYAVVATMLIGQRVVLPNAPDFTLNIDGLKHEVANTIAVWSAWLIPGSDPHAMAPYADTAVLPLVCIVMGIAGLVALVRWPSIGLVLLWPIVVLAGSGLAISSDAFEFSNAYPAGIGIVCLLPMLIQRFPKGSARTAMGIVAAGLIFVSLGKTHFRNAEWRDEVYFWTLAQEDCPECYAPNAHLAALYKQDGDRIIEKLDGATPTTAQLEEAKRHWKAAEGLWLKAQSLTFESGKWDHELAQVQAGQGKLNEAIETMKQFMGVHPDDVDAIRSLAQWYGERANTTKDPSDIRRGVEHYTQLNTLTELSDIDRLQWAIFLYQLGAFPESGQQFRLIRSAELRQQASEIIQQLSPRLETIAKLQKDIDQSIKTQALQLELFRMRTKQLLAEGNLQLAQYYAEETLRISSRQTLPEDWYRLGHIYGLKGHWSTFIQYWSTYESESYSWSAMADFCADQGNWNTALMALMRRPVFPGTDPQSEALLSLGKLAIQKKQYQQAGSILQSMTQQFPQRFEPWLQLAEIALTTKQPELINGYLREAKIRGASDAKLKELRDRAGLKESITDSLAPTIIR